MLAPAEPEFTEDSIPYEFESVDALEAFFNNNFGPTIALRSALPPDRLAELDAKYRAMVEEVNEATDGTVRVTAEYLMTTVQL